MKSFARIKTAGFSLLELLLVVAVGAVLILAGLGAYRLVNENNNANQSSRSLMTLKQQIQQSFTGQANYGTANTNLIDDLNNLRAIPPEIIVTGTGNGAAAKGTFGAVTMAVGSTNTTFTIGFAGVPRNACVRLAQQFTPTNSSDFVSLTIGTTAITNFNQTGTGALVTTCAASDNTMTWTFR